MLLENALDDHNDYEREMGYQEGVFQPCLSWPMVLTMIGLFQDSKMVPTSEMEATGEILHSESDEVVLGVSFSCSQAIELSCFMLLLLCHGIYLAYAPEPTILRLRQLLCICELETL